MKLADFKQEDGSYVFDECHYEDAKCMIQSGVFEFCCCGNPTDNLNYILRGLELINKRSPDNVPREVLDTWYAEHKARTMEHFRADEAMWFFYYWADKEGLTEHGGSVPGWLTEKGKDILSLLREWNALERKGNEDVSVP